MVRFDILFSGLALLLLLPLLLPMAANAKTHWGGFYYR